MPLQLDPSGRVMPTTPPTTAQPSASQPIQAPQVPQAPSGDFSDKNVVALQKAIRQHESGGNYKLVGKSGEFGAYQYLQPTWKASAKQFLGDENAQPTAQNQDIVTYRKIKALKDQGKTPDQIAGIWNSGTDQYGGKIGVSKGVRYNTPKYARDVMSTYQKNAQDMLQQMQSGQTAPIAPQAPKPGFFSDPETGMNIVKGIGKGLGSTLFNIGKLGAKGMEALTGTSPTMAAGAGTAASQQKPGFLTPKGTAQNIGYGGEQIGEFLVPFGGEEKAAEFGGKLAEEILPKAAEELGALTTFGRGAIKAIPKVGLQAAEFGAKTAAQTGSLKEGLKAAKYGGIFGAAMEAIAPALEATMPKIAQALERSNLRLTPAKEAKMGEKITDAVKWITENNLGATAAKKYENASRITENMEEQLSNALKNDPQALYKGSSTQALKEKADQLYESMKNDRNFRSERSAVKAEIEDFKKNLDEGYSGGDPNKDVDINLYDLNEEKRAYSSRAFNSNNEMKDAVKYRISDMLRQVVEDEGKGLKINGQDINAFNREYGRAISARKLLNIARFKKESSVTTRMISALFGHALGESLGGPIAGAAGAAVADVLAGTVATPLRSTLAKGATGLAGSSEGFLKSAAKLSQARKNLLSQ